MSDKPGEELLDIVSKRAPVNPFGAKYRDPITIAIISLPFIPDERRQALVGKWDENKPASWLRAMTWYAQNDQTLLLLGRLIIVASPIVLTQIGLDLMWIISFVVASTFVVEWFDRVRVSKERMQVKEEVKREYWNEVDRPRKKERRRELFQQLHEELDEEEQVEPAESKD